MASLKVGTGLDAPISNRTEAAAEVAARVAQQDAAPGKGKPAAGLASGIEKVQGFSLPKVAASRSAKEVLSGALDLPDIAEASFGAGARQVPKSVLETVHGPDDRVKITSTNVYPWRAHASLLITARDGSMWIGTGWFIGPHTLMTAGHVVYIKNSGVPGSRRLRPVHQGDAGPQRRDAALRLGHQQQPADRRRAGPTTATRSTTTARSSSATDLGNTTGWFGFGVYNDATLTASVGNISGYPGDKPDGTQWYAARRIASVAARKVYYDIDTFGGQSGSAVYRIVDGKRYAFAVHAYGGATTNSGTRIVTPVYNNMVAWKA